MIAYAKSVWFLSEYKVLNEHNYNTMQDPENDIGPGEPNVLMGMPGMWQHQ